ncbi:MAG TPA: ThiF family adenylyltransferase, partial [Acidobacteriota bacterium]|nr:ThiF family adenylyltransferase [Acidobacteriota bacterium]
MNIRLTDPAEDRYQRLRLIRWWDQDRLHAARVLVLGAGALGNEVCKNLALLGLGSIWIVDFDKIETSNLTRSALFRAQDVGGWKAEVLAERARQLNPDCAVTPLRVDARYELGLGFLSQMDVIFGCLDNREARYYMNRNCYLLEKLFIDGGLDALNGSVTVFKPPQTPCYECTLSNIDRLELQKRISCLKADAAEVKQHVPTAPTIASIVGGLQVQIAVRFLHGLEIPLGKRLGLYGLSDVFFEMKLEQSEDCGMHSAADTIQAPVSTMTGSENDPLLTILDRAKQNWRAESLTWDFDRDLITGLYCIECGVTRTFVGTHARYEGSSFCECGGPLKPEIATSYNSE